MKVSNSKFAKRQSYILLTGIILIFIVAVFFGWSIYNIFIIPVLFIFIYLFLFSKSTSIELSGGCVTIRKNHPLSFKKFVTPFFELPYSRLLGYNISTNFGISTLILKINSKRKNKFLLKTSLRGFSRLQKGKIETSLATVTMPPDNTGNNMRRVA